MSAPYQVMPSLGKEDFARLKDSIAEIGVQIPVEMDENGNVLDGHHREKACIELGIKHWPTIIRTGLNEAEKKAHARALNVNRRHLTREQKQALICDQLRDTPKLSDRAIAARLAVDHKTVARQRRSLAGRGEIPHVDRVIDTLGRKQSRPAPVYVDDSPQGRTAAVQRAREIRSQNKRAQIGTQSATKAERGHDLYETPDCATRSLLALEEFGKRIWEPACGRGAIIRVLETAGLELEISDLNDYGTTREDGTGQGVFDFCELAHAPYVVGSIITNPPYDREVLNRFVARSVQMLEAGEISKIAMLMNLNVLCGFGDPDREYFMETMPPARIHVFKRRLPMMHRDGWDGPQASSSMNTAWFVWEAGHTGPSVINRVDWKDHAGEVSQ
jgi:ParB-like chromosome segregation protein Spo0J